MSRDSLRLRFILALVVASMWAAIPGFSQPPPGKGAGKKHEDERWDGKDKGKDRDRDGARRPEPPRQSGAAHRHFEDRHRVIVRDYYANEYRTGRCPPGLAKKNNGCMPPGQAKKWNIGHPLPRDVIFYDLPPSLVIQIGTPPPGYRFVRVAADVLLIAIGTGLVIDALTDLGNM